MMTCKFCNWRLVDNSGGSSEYQIADRNADHKDFASEISNGDEKEPGSE